MQNFSRRITLGCALAAALLAMAGPAGAQTKLKWAHVYEVAEPYHTQALWAAEEIKKRTAGRYEIGVFPASQLGNENQINEGLGLGTVDIIYTGTSFAGSIHKPLGISGAPFMMRDFAHWKAYRDSKLFRDIAKGYEDKTKHKIVALTYYGERMVTANKAITKPEDMKGMKLRVPPAPLYLMLAKSVGANATPIAFAEVYLALQQGTVDGQENPLPTIMAKKFYEVHAARPFYGELVEFMMSAPVVVQVLEGEGAVAKYREVMGATNPADAADGTIRKLYAKNVGENSVHGSDSAENAALEITQFFTEADIVG